MQVSLDLQLPRDASYIPVMRNVMSSLLSDLRAPRSTAGDLLLAVDEACSNVVRHAAGTEQYSVKFWVDRGLAVVEVSDLGPGFPVHPDAPSALEAEGGRGIALIRELVDELRFVRTEQATLVTLTKHWTRGEERSDHHAADVAGTEDLAGSGRER